jgi:oligosaccharide 4-alpha-D-glucosyltransferase
MGYHSQAEVEAVVEGFRRDDIPLDAVVLDLFWFGASIYGNMGNLDWDRETFPEPESP